MKLRTTSGRLDVSLTHVPGRGSGTFELSTESQAEVDDACSLNFPIKNKILYNEMKQFGSNNYSPF